MYYKSSVFPKKKIEFKKGINILYGANGSGKTTILESIYILSLGKSFKTTTASNYITQNEKEYNVLGELEDKTKIEVKGKTNKKTIFVNNQIIKKISNHIYLLPVIIHTPEDSVLEGKNNQRRNKNINKNLSVISQRYLETIKTFSLILKQRNAAIKTKTNPALWDEQFACYAKKIWEEKEIYEKTINKNMENINKKHNPSMATKLKIKGIEKTKTKILKNLKETINKDREKGYTTIGPQQDRIKYFFNEREIKTGVSQGEKTLFFSILKKSEAKTIKEKTKKDPIILLDDIFSKLDQKNIKKVLEMFRNHQQTIITHTTKTGFLKTNQIQIND